MSDPKTPEGDLSMDDILASIRKIISDDEARAQAGGLPAAGQTTRPSALSGSESQVAPGRSTDHQDVLLLTDLIEDDQRAVPISSPQPARSTTFHQPLTPPSFTEADSAEATISVLRRLNEAVQDDTPVSALTPGPVLGGGSDKTIEDMVSEMLRPMLKDWIDQNLPAMVQAIVEREISRPTRR